MKDEHPHARGIAIQKRLIVSAICILAEIVIICLLQRAITERFIWVYTFAEILAVITVIYIVNAHSNPSYKIAWLIFILVVPIFGVTFYVLCGGGRVLPHIKKYIKQSKNYYMPKVKQDEDVKNKLFLIDEVHSRQASYLTNESGFPLYEKSSVTYLSPGEIFLERLLKELNKAEKYIYIEFFILAEGYMWDAVHDVLSKKVRQGVEIKIIFDDFGSIRRQYKNFTDRLIAEGISVSAFNKIKPSFDIFMNNRNHRKIIVIDGQTAFTGGANIADEYINKLELHGHWLDSMVMIKGLAVSSFLAMFCTMWDFTKHEKIDFEAHNLAYPVEAAGFVLPYCDDPMDDCNPAEGIYMQIINTSRKYVYITTPYLILDTTVCEALKLAAKSGIDIRIVTPGIPDKKYVHPVTRYYYEELLDAGIRIYEYTPGFIHSKMFVSDDRVATVGTVNMDYRSFVFHFECGAWIAESSTVTDIKHHFDKIFEISEEITRENWKKRSWISKFNQKMLHLFSPFM